VNDSEASRSGTVPPLKAEFNQLSNSEALWAFYRIYLEFILRRVVHDLGNSIYGINSLSDYHLRSGVNDSALEESLGLIRDSAEHSRHLLAMVGDLLQPAETAEEPVNPAELLQEASKIIKMLLPRSVQLEIAQNEDDGATWVSIMRGDFLRKVLALAAMEINHLRVASGKICLGWDREESRIRIFYRSVFNPASDLRSLALSLMEHVSRDVDVSSSNLGEEFAITLSFPLIRLDEPGST
jgi:hypothetical protein